MNTYILLLAALALAYLFSRSFMLSIIQLSDKYRLYDKANLIKLHKEQVSSLGGVAIFSVFWLLAFVFVKNDFLPHFFTGSLVLFLIGLRDDLLGLHAYFRLAVQVVVACLLIYWGMTFPQFTAFGLTIPSWAATAITAVFVLGVINAWNFIDGSNGLAAGLSLVSTASFGFYFLLGGDTELALLTCLLAGAMAGFATFNFGNKARAFMGDNGSTFTGLVLAFLVISFIQEGKHLPVSNATLVQLCLAPLFVPFADMARVVLVRLARGRSPFKGDRTHIHHLMMARGFSPVYIALILMALQALVIVFAVAMPVEIFLTALALLTAGFYLFLLRKKVVAMGQHQLKPVKTKEESLSKVAP
ncbi:MAG: MraY family glycosyltransferase [Saprospiraceae bacterium]